MDFGRRTSLTTCNMNLHRLAKALGGEVISGAVSAPGPGHSPDDRSMRVFIAPNSPFGFRVHSLAGDDWRDCLNYIKSRLGIADVPHHVQRMLQPRPVPQPDPTKIRASEMALRIWNDAGPIVRSPVAFYLEQRNINPIKAESHVIRFHPDCPFRLQDGITAPLPAMVVLFRDIVSDEPCGIHRTALKPDGSGKADVPGLGGPKKMLGRVKGAAIKLSADAEVTTGLHIAEGIETGLTGLSTGLAPVWALGSAGSIAAFPPLPGIEALTILADHDEAGLRAARVCAEAWSEAGCEASIIYPPVSGEDWNDAV